MDCIRSKKKLLEERLLIGDPNAQFTYYILYLLSLLWLNRSTKYGFFGFPKDTYLSTTHLHFSAESHSVAGSLSLATRLQTGDRQAVNLTRALEIAIPAWHSITSLHSSLFDALYLPSETEVRFLLPPMTLLVAEGSSGGGIRRFRLRRRASLPAFPREIPADQTPRLSQQYPRKSRSIVEKSRDLAALLDLYRDVGFGDIFPNRSRKSNMY